MIEYTPDFDELTPSFDNMAESLPDAERGSVDSKAEAAAEYVLSRYSRAKEAKQKEEDRALRAYQNYRGVYQNFSKTEKSQVFVKVTKTKVLAAYGQLVEVLFGNNKFPLSIDPQNLPEGVSESVHLETNPQASGQQSKQITEQKTSSYPEIDLGDNSFDIEMAGPMKDKLSQFADKLVDGPGSTPSSITFHPALAAAKKMEKVIHDQLEQSHANKHLRSVALDMALYGTGIMKGPFAVDQEYPKWDENGEYVPVIKTIPKVDAVSFWNFYPDPDASNMSEAQFVVERHKMSRSDLRALKRRPHFRHNVLEDVISYGENYIRESWESFLSDHNTTSDPERFEVLEYWGLCDRTTLEDEGISIPRELRSFDVLNVNIWVCNGRVLRLVLNPFKPTIIPYHVVPYEINPYSMFGIGIAENMEDTQTLMNGFMRMAVDNAALSGNLVFEVDKSSLEAGQDMELYPGKIWIREEGAPGQAVFAHTIPNVAQQNLMLFDKARVLSDESTGFPSYAHGQTDIQGVGRTASGISMLMNAANGGIRSVVKNVDDYLLAPLGKALFAFNMQFNFDPSIKGDLEVRARGTESLMANEVRSQRLMQFLGVVSNPQLMPFAKLDVILREIAKSLDLDPEKVVNNMADAALQAEIIKQVSVAQPQAPAQAQGQQPNTPSVTDATGSGGGNIGVGMAPQPGEPGFSANGNAGTGDMRG